MRRKTLIVGSIIEIFIIQIMVIIVVSYVKLFLREKCLLEFQQSAFKCDYYDIDASGEANY